MKPANTFSINKYVESLLNSKKFRMLVTYSTSVYTYIQTGDMKLHCTVVNLAHLQLQRSLNTKRDLTGSIWSRYIEITIRNMHLKLIKPWTRCLKTHHCTRSRLNCSHKVNIYFNTKQKRHVLQTKSLQRIEQTHLNARNISI